jgi:hypothetical protein
MSCGRIMSRYKSEKAKENNRLRAKKWRLINPERDRQLKKNWYLKNKDRICKIERDRSRFKLYGITIEDYEKMLVEHSYRCAICGIHQIDLEKSLNIDHDHKTGKIRGLLCIGCNLLVGRIEDLGLTDILKYFEKYNIK